MKILLWVWQHIGDIAAVINLFAAVGLMCIGDTDTAYKALVLYFLIRISVRLDEAGL